MLAVNFSNMRENFKDYCDKVYNNAETIIITRKDNKNVVLMSLDEYNNIMENLKILKNPEYFTKLFQSIRQVEKGEVHKFDMDKDFQ